MATPSTFQFDGLTRDLWFQANNLPETMLQCLCFILSGASKTFGSELAIKKDWGSRFGCGTDEMKLDRMN